MKKLECKKTDFSEYDFLRLLSATYMKERKEPIINNHELEKELYSYYDNPDYHFLFEDILKKEDILENNNYVDLSTSFQTGYTLHCLFPIQGRCKLQSMILYTLEEADNVLKEYSEEQREAIFNLVTSLQNKKEKNNQA